VAFGARGPPSGPAICSWIPASVPGRFELVIRDRDRKFTQAFDEVSAGKRHAGNPDAGTVAKGPNPYAERFAGTFRRECLDHVADPLPRAHHASRQRRNHKARGALSGRGALIGSSSPSARRTRTARRRQEAELPRT